jgi:hypothetical protein
VKNLGKKPYLPSVKNLGKKPDPPSVKNLGKKPYPPSVKNLGKKPYPPSVKNLGKKPDPPSVKNLNFEINLKEREKHVLLIVDGVGRINNFWWYLVNTHLKGIDDPTQLLFVDWAVMAR